MGKVKDLRGKRFGDLTVIERGEDYIPPSYPKNDKQVQWVCKCDCGNYCTVNVNSLRSGRQKSCGCKGSRHEKTHGMSDSITYQSWEAYVQRCTNPNHVNYSTYKDRVYSPWVKSFETFVNDLGERPSKRHSLDRIDNNKGYSPENCRWATQNVQSHNHIRKHGSCKYKGVSYNKNTGRYEAYIKNPDSPKRKEHIGFFDDEIQAAKAYDKKALEYYKENACINTYDKT